MRNHAGGNHLLGGNLRKARSDGWAPRLVRSVQPPPPRDLHPLLLEREYWRGRLEEQRSTRPFLLITPRPDLSTRSCEVQEIRFRAHDGVRIWGLVGRCPFLRNDQPAALRLVGAAEAPRIDVATVEQGRTEFVVQIPAGRRLVDRVLDALRLRQIAAAYAHIDASRVAFLEDGARSVPDEVRIVDKLCSGGLIR